jgi:hypothetical protein
MKSFTNAINNLAAAINSVANEMRKNNIDSSSFKLKKTITSNPSSITSNPASSQSYVSYSSEGWHSLTVFEKEQLYYIYKALMEKGVNPKYHETVYDKIMDLLHSKWPNLHRPIEKLVSSKEKYIQNKSYLSPKNDIWKKNI